MVVGQPLPGPGKVAITNFFGDQLAKEDEADQEYLFNIADAELNAIRKEKDAEDINRLFTSRADEDYQSAINRYTQLLTDQKSYRPDATGNRRPQAASEQYGDPYASEQYGDPYADITTDVRARIDELIGQAKNNTSVRSSEDRQNAISGLIEKLGGRPNYSDIQAAIQTPDYADWMGGSNTFDRAAQLMGTTRAARDARQGQELSFLDQLMAKAGLT